MGYQESLIRIENLGEAAGYKDAIDARKEDFHFYFFCAARAKKDMHLSPLLAASSAAWQDEPFVRKGELFAVVGGDRRPYQTCGGMIFTDFISELDEEDYHDLFEDLEDSYTQAQAENHPESRKRATAAMKGHLDRCWDD